MSNKIFIGCDPGKSGHMVVLDGQTVTKKAYKMIGKEYDLQGMLHLFSEFQGLNAHVVIEDVHAIPGSAAKATWEFSRGKTILEMCCVALKIPMTLVAPKTWQKEIWEGVPIQKKSTGERTKSGEMKEKVLTKETTLLAISRLFPNVDLRKSERSKNPDDGIFDSLALAEYGRRKFS